MALINGLSLLFSATLAMTAGRMDPIVFPGTAGGHVHYVQGGNNFNLSLTADELLSSDCTTSIVDADKSAYWHPSVYFVADNGSFISVDFYYSKVYYFMEPTNDEIQVIPHGLQIVTGNNSLRTPPSNAGINIDTNAGPIQPIQITCPRSSYNPPSYPADSNGLDGVGIQDPNNAGAGAGFPDQNCDGLYSPLRTDCHFPSCYNPAAGLSNFKENMAFPSSAGLTGGKLDCPPGWIHIPHLFMEVYWNTQVFADMWTPGQGKQPFVLSNGDATGYAYHCDFFGGWDTDVLQNIIDNCNAGDAGMNLCPNVGTTDTSGSSVCTVPNLVPEQITGVLSKLPGDNPLTGWGYGTGTSGSSSGSSSDSSGSGSSGSGLSESSASSMSTSHTTTSTSHTTTSTSHTTTSTSHTTTSTSHTTTSTSHTTTSTLHKTTSTTGNPKTSTRTSDTGSATSPTSTGGTTGTGGCSTSSSSTSADNNPGIVDYPGWSYFGCYSDDSSARVLNGITLAWLGHPGATTSECIEYCSSKGYSMAGTEWASQCFCGNELDGSCQISEDECNMKCNDDESQICGGSLALSVYQKTASKTKQHKGRHLREHLHNRHS